MLPPTINKRFDIFLPLKRRGACTHLFYPDAAKYNHSMQGEAMEIAPPSPTSTGEEEFEWPASISPLRAAWWEEEFRFETGTTNYTRLRLVTADGRVVSQVRNEGCWS